MKLTQHYTYDGLNRLKTATETSNDAPSWQETFNYDQYGNRSIDPTQTTADLVGDNPQISTSNNRIIARQNEHYHYDAAGNLDRDRADIPFTYDANNRITAFNGGATIGTNGTSYDFDGLGQRVKKATSYAATVFVYDALGKMVAEYASDGQSGAGTSYITTDALGTPRVITDASGGVRARHDYLPFGEEIGGTQVSLKGGRTSTQGYVSDGVRQKFTIKERDSESGLDYFLARDYQSGHGRFTSPDPLLASGRVGNPQTWNRYAYVGNNPVTNTDPFGLCSAEYSSCDEPYSRDRIADPRGATSREAQGGLDAYNQRLQHQYNAIAANRAIRNGDRETFWNIVNDPNSGANAVDENGNPVSNQDDEFASVQYTTVQVIAPSVGTPDSQKFSVDGAGSAALVTVNLQREHKRRKDEGYRDPLYTLKVIFYLPDDYEKITKSSVSVTEGGIYGVAEIGDIQLKGNAGSFNFSAVELNNERTNYPIHVHVEGDLRGGGRFGGDLRIRLIVSPIELPKGQRGKP